jgi:DNA-binding TFAR19-related protein (PDSD5 family)
MRKLTTWLTPEAQEALQRLSLVHGSQDAAINAALLEASQIKKNIASF